MDDIPRIYKSIIDDPANLRDQFESVKQLNFSSVLQNPDQLRQYLVQNLSLPAVDANAMIHSTVDMNEVYRLLFGTDLKTTPRHMLVRVQRSLPDFNSLKLDKENSVQQLKAVMNTVVDHIPSVKEGLLYKMVKSGEIQREEEVMRLIPSLLGLLDSDDKVDPQSMAELLKILLISPMTLKRVSCEKGELSRVLHPYHPYNTSSLDDAQIHLCNLTSDQVEQLSEELKSEINDSTIISVLHLDKANFTEAERRIRQFLSDLEEFYMFQRNLEELTYLSRSLPQDACPPTPVPNITMATTHNETDEESGQSFDEEGVENNKPHKPQNKFAGLLKIWFAMQKIFCGEDHEIPKKKLKHFKDVKGLDGISQQDLNELGFTATQQQNLGILLHLLYSNPKVLYSPNNTATDEIIKDANSSFVMIDRANEYANKWLNISTNLRDYLVLNKTAQNLMFIQRIQEDLRNHSSLLSHVKKYPKLREFLKIPVPNQTKMLDDVDTIDNAACSWNNLMSGINLNIYQGFESEPRLVDYVLNHAYADNVSVFASVVFENMADGKLPAHVKYKIRQNASFTETTKHVRPGNWYPGPGKHTYPYYHFGFVWIQDIIERAIINVQVGKPVVEPGTFLHQFPYPCFRADIFLFMIEHVVPLLMTISWVYSVAMLVQSIVYEKEQRLKEVMKMMGLNNAVHWCAWFITSFLQMSITMATLTLMLHFGNIIQYSNPAIIFLTLEVFALATIWFSFLISVLYSKAKVAAACAGIVYFLTYVPYMYIAIREGVAGDKVTALEKSLGSLFSTTAFGLGAKYFAYYEETGVGVQWSNIHISPVEDDQYNLLYVIIMMLVDFLIYGLLVWYIENVHPGSFGLPKPWYFPLTRSYWCGHSKNDSDQLCLGIIDWLKQRGHHYMPITEEDQACAMQQSDMANGHHFEQDPSHIPMGVSINGLSKKYKKSNKLAVNSLTLNLYEGQITSFLGHNGAGKTTTMSILTGLFPPTSGYATIYGQDIRTDMDAIRKSLGMCPQHSVLFDKLTVEEHLWFYGRLKGVSPKDIKAEMARFIQDVGLPNKKKCRVDCLSGGMQRKLSVAIAFVGGSRTVILDEPTAGVDPYARRAIWDLLVKYKEGRTILLSTHHMDEADILGDRIAIISNGQLKCAGSSVFLKNTFGDGYHLTLVKRAREEDTLSTGSLQQDDLDISQNSSVTFRSKCDASKVTTFISQHVSTAYLVSETNQILSYNLPFEEAKKGNFEKLFEALDGSLVDLELCSYGVVDTSLEEVFLSVTEKAKLEDSIESDTKELDSMKDPANDTINSDDDVPLLSAAGETLGNTNTGLNSDVELLDVGGESEAGLPGPVNEHELLYEPPASFRRNDGYARLESEETTPKPVLEGRGSYMMDGAPLRLNQFRAVIVKRFYYIKRNWKALFSQILLPALFVCVAMTVALAAPGRGELPPLELSPSQYFNLTQPRGNFIPFSNHKPYTTSKKFSTSAGPEELIDTLHLASGIGATCVLKSPFNSTLDMQLLKGLNNTLKNYDLLAKYFEPSCQSVFVHGLPLENFVPRAPTVSAFTDENNTMSSVTASPTENIYYPKCRCVKDKSGFICQNNDGHDTPPEFKVVTSDIIQDIGATSDHNFYLYTSNEYRLHRYGGLAFGVQNTEVPENFGQRSPASFHKLAVRELSKVWFNNKGYHSMPTYLNVINNAILRANLPKSKGNPAAYGITAINHPMEKTNNKLSMDIILQGSDVLISIFIIVAMSFVPSSFVLYLVYEKSIKAKHLQFVSGIDPVIYWLGNYVWDMCNYLIPSACCIGILLVFQIPAYSSPSNIPVVIGLFLLYGWSMTPMMYPASFVFKEPSTAYIFLIVINLFTGITCVICSFLLEIFSYNKDLDAVHQNLKNVFLLFPNYCLGRGLMDLGFNEYKNDFFFKTGQYNQIQSPFQWDLTGRNLVAMGVMGLVFFIITILLEQRFFIRRRQKSWSPMTVQDEDGDVAAERKRVMRGSGRHDLIRLENITKVYKTRKLGRKLAVDRLCLGVPEGECFGLLGVNGAGKTTAFKMLTGDIRPTGGDAWLNRYSVTGDLLKVQQNIGYCPQFDALYDQLTAREHLQLYSRLRGIPPKDERQVVDWALNKLCLMRYADKPSGTYSGGNKRKLSTAIALIGQPPVIFLDEPTTGMDPHSRRFLWDIILRLIKEGKSIVLTSHSMEECEALCTRLAIMVNGRFQCLGSAQHLKNKYGDGYTMGLRLQGPDYDRSLFQVKRFIERHFPEAVLKDEHHNILQFELKSPIQLSYVFSKLEEARSDLPVEDYSVSQNTLDNVFINFVSQQAEIVREAADSGADLLDVPPRRASQEAPRERPITEQDLEEEYDAFDATFDTSQTHLSFNMEEV
ncbi:ATP-binding cassette sub-family A member 2-like [Liolophura sinensis]|uniref:ATP-binding cassette sub-family A member 2-like n=1 Tax=Liolophura sinensis TaxID=3198878 RepID=UPI00315826C5